MKIQLQMKSAIQVQDISYLHHFFLIQIDSLNPKMTSNAHENRFDSIFIRIVLIQFSNISHDSVE